MEACTSPGGLPKQGGSAMAPSQTPLGMLIETVLESHAVDGGSKPSRVHGLCCMLVVPGLVTF